MKRTQKGGKKSLVEGGRPSSKISRIGYDPSALIITSKSLRRAHASFQPLSSLLSQAGPRKRVLIMLRRTLVLACLALLAGELKTMFFFFLEGGEGW
jgi:hypothetical protein